jgi:predicted acyltransferase
MKAEAKSERIISVDFLRGLTVAFMIFVNSPGSWDYVFPWFAHSKWNGCTPTDLIFPFFLFVVGISICLSLTPIQYKPVTTTLVVKLFKRAGILFLLGLLLNGFPYYRLDTLRIPGVLQRIAIVFLVCAFVFLYTSARFQLELVIIILLVYWAVIAGIPVPGGCACTSTLEPGNSIAAWVDHLLLNNHVWSQTKPWDPEGVLGTVPAIASGLIGLLAGFLMREENDRKKTIYLFIAANLLLLLGITWNEFFPVNKSLWTSSYVLYTSGIAMHVLALSYWTIDVMKYQRFTKPFLVFGSNAITAYIISEVLEACLNLIPVSQHVSVKAWVYEHLYASWLNPYLASHIMALSFVLIVYLPIYGLYRKRIFIKI